MGPIWTFRCCLRANGCRGYVEGFEEGGGGAAYVFVRNNSVWSQQAHLKAPNRDVGLRFGWALAISGDKLVIGADYAHGSGTGVNPPDDFLVTASGAAYIFVRSGTTWNLQAYLKASNNKPPLYPYFGDQFGTSVAVGIRSSLGLRSRTALEPA